MGNNATRTRARTKKKSGTKIWNSSIKGKDNRSLIEILKHLSQALSSFP